MWMKCFLLGAVMIIIYTHVRVWQTDEALSTLQTFMMCLVSSVSRFHEFEMGLYCRRSALRSHVGPALQQLGAKGAN